jgi:hypothetical protein
MTPNWVIVELRLPRDGISPLCGGRGKRKSDCVKFAILALTAKLTQTVPRAPRILSLKCFEEGQLWGCVLESLLAPEAFNPDVLSTLTVNIIVLDP